MKRKIKENYKNSEKNPDKPSEKKEKGKQTKVTEYPSMTFKTTTSNVSEKQATSSIESLSPEKSKCSSIVCDAFVTPPRTGSQIQASTPQSPNDLFFVNIPKAKYMSLDNIDKVQERMAELPGTTDLVGGALSPDT